MSLFDVIRYPIDINFTIEDLERIPCNIMNDWCNEFVLKNGGNTCTPAARALKHGNTPYRMSSYMNHQCKVKRKEYVLRALLCRLKEYDEPI